MKYYQNQVERTRNFNETELPNYALGLVCEAGEFGDMVKKHLYQGHTLDLDKCKEELGDVLWYLANICNVLNIDLAEVAKGNVEKLKKRYPNGFSKSDSINRDKKIKIDFFSKLELIKYETVEDIENRYNNVHINEGDYVKTDEFDCLNTNTVYKVSHVLDTGVDRFISLYGCGDIEFKAELFRKVEVK